LQGAGVDARGVVVMNAAEPKSKDPIYGDALPKTWKWLTEGSRDVVDFAICSNGRGASVREMLASRMDAGTELRIEGPLAPILLPAHLDALSQTSPRPAVEPDISLFLHGAEKAAPQVQVIWRADLDVKNPGAWAEIVSLCPPVTAEAMPVPLHEFRAWLTGKGAAIGATGDLEGRPSPGTEEGDEPQWPVLRWRGDQSQLVLNGSERDSRDPSEVSHDRIRPGDTLVLAAAVGGWNELGHVPGVLEDKSPVIDAAERGRVSLRRPGLVRVHEQVLRTWPDSPARDRLLALSRNPPADRRDVVAALGELAGDAPEWLEEMYEGKQLERWDLNRYPDESGWVLSERAAQTDSGEDESSSGDPIRLDRHLTDVAQAAGVVASRAVDAELAKSIQRAAEWHDCGKADRRFQALLLGGDPIAAQFAPRPLAKGAVPRQSRTVRRALWKRSRLPDGFRHELVSLALAMKDAEVGADDLALHLIATHHGRCRPLAPFVDDPEAPSVVFGSHRLSSDERRDMAAHRIDSSIADRFWKLTRRYGWWGLAYLECLLRLGDWDASEKEQEEKISEAQA
jgi:CRISPR-associated endonuclease/helicase Cas3